MLNIVLGHAAAHHEGAAGMNFMGIIGAIADKNSRSGKEAIVAIKMALEDFYQYSNQRFVLRIRNSQGDPLKASLAARDLIEKKYVQAVIGPQTWEETTLVAEELEKLRGGQCRAFVVISSLPVAIDLFETADKMNMMEKDSVWITTGPFTSLVHSLNASTISSMQGIIGVKSYVPEIGHQYEDFYLKFRQKFSLDNPQESNNEPGIFAVHAYDAAWTVALAMSQKH
ncbi:Receptor, ligand binding region [Sesbania bispinosa]|nr:Receptor, ligand binding region [Sesbania bispinosa]